MHIIMGLLGILAAVGIWIYRINMASKGAQELAETAGEMANLPRKLRFKSKAAKKGLALVEDPREAATILMLGVARSGGEVSLEQKREIARQISTHFDFNAAGAEELTARAAWISSDLAEPTEAVSRMIDLIVRRVSGAELEQLISMLDAVAAAEGQPSKGQTAFIRRCRQRAGLR